MSEQLIRVYQKFDVTEVQKQLIICGDLSAACGNCHEINLKNNDAKCPHCGAEFKYIAFRNVKNNLPKLNKIFEQRPSLKIIDLDDFQHHAGAMKARSIFGDS